MNINVKQFYDWSEETMGAAIQAVAKLFDVCPGDIKDAALSDLDMRYATDLIVPTAEGEKVIAVRSRDWDYFYKYKHDITLRAAVISGNKTEYQKVIHDGYGDYMFYYFVAPNGKQIAAYRLIDLEKLRAHKDQLDAIEGKTNHGSGYTATGFVAVDMRKYTDCILEEWTWEHSRSSGFRLL